MQSVTANGNEIKHMISDNNDCNCTDPCADVLEGQPTKCEKCSNRMKAGWVAGIPAPASVAEDLKSERELQAKRVQAQQAASIAGQKMAAAASGPLAGGMAAPIGTATNKVARNAVALVMAMTLSVWQGKQSAPWRYDGSHPFICMTQS